MRRSAARSATCSLQPTGTSRRPEIARRRAGRSSRARAPGERIKPGLRFVIRARACAAPRHAPSPHVGRKAPHPSLVVSRGPRSPHPYAASAAPPCPPEWDTTPRAVAHSRSHRDYQHPAGGSAKVRRSQRRVPVRSGRAAEKDRACGDRRRREAFSLPRGVEDRPEVRSSASRYSTSSQPSSNPRRACFVPSGTDSSRSRMENEHASGSPAKTTSVPFPDGRRDPPPRRVIRPRAAAPGLHRNVVEHAEPPPWPERWCVPPARLILPMVQRRAPLRRSPDGVERTLPELAPGSPTPHLGRREHPAPRPRTRRARLTAHRSAVGLPDRIGGQQSSRDTSRGDGRTSGMGTDGRRRAIVNREDDHARTVRAGRPGRPRPSGPPPPRRA
jgi:hypothetical protein